MLRFKLLVLLLGLPGILMRGVLVKRNVMRCVCIPYFQCGEDGRVDLYGSDSINERFGNEDSSGNHTLQILTGPNPICSSGVDVCCELPEESEEENEENPSAPVLPQRPVKPVTHYPSSIIHPPASPVIPSLKPISPSVFNPHLIPSPPVTQDPKTLNQSKNPILFYASDHSPKPIQYNTNPTPDFLAKPCPYDPNSKPDDAANPMLDYPINPLPDQSYPQSTHEKDSAHMVEPLVPNLKGCGLKRLSPFNARLVSDRITGPNDEPEDTFFGEYPWMIAVFRETDGEKIFTCGGSLIDFKVVLTAAHCVYKLQAHEIHVRAGEWDSRLEHKPIPHQDRQVSRVSIHHHFDSKNLRNDIALLFLDEPFHQTKTVDTICIPEENSFEPVHCQATGWGINSFNERGIFQPILKKVELPLIDRDTCLRSLRKTRLGHFFKLHKSFICAGGQVNQDTCTGDGGGPLVCDNFDGSGFRFAQVGIVSWGIECGHDTPGVYVSVSHFHDWIYNQIL